MATTQPLVWLVTGCSSGFGEQIIKSILQRGDKAIATARNIESIADLKSLGATTLQLDVSAPAEELNRNVAEAIAVHGHVDVIVHNAGAIQYGAVEDLTTDMLLRQFETNTFGPLNLTTAILPHFRERKAGHIVLVSSSIPWTGGPGLGGHAASKAAADITSLPNPMREPLFSTMASEIQTFGIKTLILQPGSFRTNITNPSRYHFPPSIAYKETMEWMEKHLAELNGTQQGDPARFAEVVVDLVKGQGYAEGKEVPTKLVVGSDVSTFRGAWLDKEKATNEEWMPLVANTNFGAKPYEARKHDEPLPEPWQKMKE